MNKSRNLKNLSFSLIFFSLFHRLFVESIVSRSHHLRSVSLQPLQIRTTILLCIHDSSMQENTTETKQLSSRVSLLSFLDSCFSRGIREPQRKSYPLKIFLLLFFLGGATSLSSSSLLTQSMTASSVPATLPSIYAPMRDLTMPALATFLNDDDRNEDSNQDALTGLPM